MGVKLVSASGGSVELVAPATATNYTATMPANTGTVITTASTFAGTGPAFSAYAGTSTSIATAVFTKIAFNTEEFDTASCFDSTTNYRFTPNVAGYYSVSSVVNTNQTSNGLLVSVYKNGARFKDLNLVPYIGSIGTVCGGNALIYMNGSTDYVEIYAIQVTGVTVSSNASSQNTYFQAALVRAA